MMKNYLLGDAQIYYKQKALLYDPAQFFLINIFYDAKKNKSSRLITVKLCVNSIYSGFSQSHRPYQKVLR